MRDPLSRLFSSFSSFSSSQDSLIHRIRENLQQLFSPARIFPSSANGAPLLLPSWNGYARSRRGQSASLLTHVAVIAALTFFVAHPPGRKGRPTPFDGEKGGVLSLPPDLFNLLRGLNPRGGTGSGTGHDLLPPTQGNLPARSSLQLVKPTLPHNQNPALPVPRQSLTLPRRTFSHQ